MLTLAYANERSGIPAKGFESLPDLPPRDTALLLFGQERSLTRWQIESLTVWIEGGGHHPGKQHQPSVAG